MFICPCCNEFKPPEQFNVFGICFDCALAMKKSAQEAEEIQRQEAIRQTIINEVKAMKNIICACGHRMDDSYGLFYGECEGCVCGADCGDPYCRVPECIARQVEEANYFEADRQEFIKSFFEVLEAAVPHGA